MCIILWTLKIKGLQLELIVYREKGHYTDWLGALFIVFHCFFPFLFPFFFFASSICLSWWTLSNWPGFRKKNHVHLNEVFLWGVQHRRDTCAAWLCISIGQRAEAKTERLEVRWLILSNGRGSMKLTKEAEERGSRRLVKKEDGKCYGNSSKC